jgi:hypothetical protein
MGAETEQMSLDGAQSRTGAYPSLSFWLGGVLLLAGLMMTPLWVGLLGWLAYRVALAILGDQSCS